MGITDAATVAAGADAGVKCCSAECVAWNANKATSCDANSWYDASKAYSLAGARPSTSCCSTKCAAWDAQVGSSCGTNKFMVTDSSTKDGGAQPATACCSDKCDAWGVANECEANTWIKTNAQSVVAGGTPKVQCCNDKCDAWAAAATTHKCAAGRRQKASLASVTAGKTPLDGCCDNNVCIAPTAAANAKHILTGVTCSGLTTGSIKCESQPTCQPKHTGKPTDKDHSCPVHGAPLVLGGCVPPLTRTIECDMELMSEKQGGDASFCVHYFKANQDTTRGRRCSRAAISIESNVVSGVAWMSCTKPVEL